MLGRDDVVPKARELLRERHALDRRVDRLRPGPVNTTSWARQPSTLGHRLARLIDRPRRLLAERIHAGRIAELILEGTAASPPAPSGEGAVVAAWSR